MVQGVESLNGWAGLEVFLPNGRKLGVVHDAVIDIQSLKCRHLFVKDTPDDLVEGGIHLAVPWRWIRAINDVVVLRWFPPTRIPRNP